MAKELKYTVIALGMLSLIMGCNKEAPSYTTLQFEINAPLSPLLRGDYYEDPLYDWLHRNGGDPIGGGGGTSLGPDGHATSDFYVDLASKDQIQGAIRFVESLGVPEGSSYTIDGKSKTRFGDRKCLIVSLDKKTVAEKSYEEFLDEMRDALGDAGKLLAASEKGPIQEFWIYGVDLDEMKKSIERLFAMYPSLHTRILE